MCRGFPSDEKTACMVISYDYVAMTQHLQLMMWVIVLKIHVSATLQTDLNEVQPARVHLGPKVPLLDFFFGKIWLSGFSSDLFS